MSSSSPTTFSATPGTAAGAAGAPPATSSSSSSPPPSSAVHSPTHHDHHHHHQPCWARRRMTESDVIIMDWGRDDLSFVKLTRGGFTQNRFGIFQHDVMLDGDKSNTTQQGKRYGSSWTTSVTHAKNTYRAAKKRKRGEALTEADLSSMKPGHVRVLAPFPETWTLALSHRTQIIYTVDAALIVFHLDLVPGSVVVESGTGSGSLTVALARAVAPRGHVHTFEFNVERMAKARTEFADLGLSSIVTVEHRDACSEAGFGPAQHYADAVFLDLPTPWTAIPNAIKALKKDTQTRFCSFSPCIEQVTRTHSMLDSHGFSQIRAFECLVRVLEPYRFDRDHIAPPLWDNSNVKRQVTSDGKPRGTGFDTEMATHTGYIIVATRFPQM